MKNDTSKGKSSPELSRLLEETKSEGAIIDPHNPQMIEELTKWIIDQDKDDQEPETP
jgi:hypothetical protein